MPAGEIHENDFGQVIRDTIRDQDDAVADISSYTTRQITFTKPDGTKVTKSASFTTDGTDGKIQYTVESGFMTPAGIWRHQGYVYNGTASLSSDIVSFKVYENL